MKILRRKEVEMLTGLSRSTIYKNLSKGTFPKPITLSSKAVGWLESELNEWLSARISERDSSQF